jgi:hypothetical protein
MRQAGREAERDAGEAGTSRARELDRQEQERQRRQVVERLHALQVDERDERKCQRPQRRPLDAEAHRRRWNSAAAARLKSALTALSATAPPGTTSAFRTSSTGWPGTREST